MQNLYHNARDGCAGRWWLPRLLLWGYLAYVGVRLAMAPEYWSIFHPLNLVIHEMGHPLFGWLGELPGVAGGTILQLAAPVLAAGILARQSDYFGITVCLCWLDTNLYHVGAYMADAVVQELPLVQMGFQSEPAQHDWAFMLERWDLLDRAEQLGWWTERLGDLAMLAGLAAGAWLIWLMFRQRHAP
ncbi:MAG: hypothetical protein KKI02_11495, partial [Planctomycetes bacterium]|nr:hypothetical protein [Planctomycetota bacterium]